MLNETISLGLNDPNCAFFVGSFMGSWMIFKIVFILIGMYWIAQIIDKIAFKPFIEWVKKKRYKKKK